MAASIHEIATRYVDGVKGHADPNFADLFAPTVVVSHVYDEQPMEVEASGLIAGILNDQSGFEQVMPDYRSSEVRVFYGEHDFVIARTVAGTLRDGTKIKYDFSAIIAVSDGKVARIDVYQDRQQAAPLSAAIQAARAQAAE